MVSPWGNVTTVISTPSCAAWYVPAKRASVCWSRAPSLSGSNAMGIFYPFLNVSQAHHGASHDNLSDGYERISRWHVEQYAYLASKLDSMPEGDGTVLDNTCLMFLSNLWIGRKHDNSRLPLVLAGGLGGTLETEPADMPWGVRMFRLRDPDGFKALVEQAQSATA